MKEIIIEIKIIVDDYCSESTMRRSLEEHFEECGYTRFRTLEEGRTEAEVQIISVKPIH